MNRDVSAEVTPLSRSAALIVMSVITLQGNPGIAQTLGDNGWELVYDEDSIQVHRRSSSTSDVVETLTLSVIDETPERVFSVITAYPQYAEFMPHVIESRIVAQRDQTQTIFQRIRISELLRFIIKDRYHIVSNHLLLPQGDANHYRIEWSIDLPATRALQIDNAIATEINTGYWDLRATDDGTATLVEYYLHTDPGGSIPKTFVNTGTTQSIPAVIHAIRDRLGAD